MNYPTLSCLLIAPVLVFGCSQTQPTATKHNHSHSVSNAKTIKVGADLTFTHEFQSPPETGRDTVITIQVNHSYSSGRLTLSAVGDDVVSVFAPTADKQVTLEDRAPVSWDVNVRPLSEGTGYISINGEVLDENGQSTLRAYSIPISTGEAIKAKPRALKAVIFEAEETID